jgi:copper chaperone CopZ
MKQIISFVAAIAACSYTHTATAQQPDTLKTATLQVINLHCANDMPTIKKRLLNQDGIDDVTFTPLRYESSSFTIHYHTAVTTALQIEKLIETTPSCDDPNEYPYRVAKARKTKQ